MSQDKPLESDPKSGSSAGSTVLETTSTVTSDGQSAVKSAPTAATQVSKSPMQIALNRLGRDKVAMASLGAILFFVTVAILHPVLGTMFLKDPNEIGDSARQFTDRIADNTLPYVLNTWEHPFGIEPRTGRDLYRLWIDGSWPSLVVAVATAALVTIIGTVLGMVAGFLGGWVDRVISWFIDFLLSLPFLLMAIAIVPIVVDRFGSKDANGNVAAASESFWRFLALIFVLTIFGWTSLARLVRSQVMALKEREFVMAARALGVPVSRILFKEILPNLLSTIIVSLSVAIPGYVSAEAGLSFLGVGLKPPTISWGQTIAIGRNSYDTYPLHLWLPVLGIVLLVLALSLLGDAISDAFNPHTRR